MKAGKVKSGEFSTEQSVKAYKAYLVIIADDASANTKKNFTDMCKFYEVPIIITGTKEDIGHALGKELRASAAVLDEGFAKSILKTTTNIQGPLGFTKEDEK